MLSLSHSYLTTQTSNNPLSLHGLRQAELIQNREFIWTLEQYHIFVSVAIQKNNNNKCNYYSTVTLCPLWMNQQKKKCVGSGVSIDRGKTWRSVRLRGWLWRKEWWWRKKENGALAAREQVNHRKSHISFLISWRWHSSEVSYQVGLIVYASFFAFVFPTYLSLGYVFPYPVLVFGIKRIR